MATDDPICAILEPDIWSDDRQKRHAALDRAVSKVIYEDDRVDMTLLLFLAGVMRAEITKLGEQLDTHEGRIA